MTDILQTIRDLQFTHTESAQALLLAFIQQQLPALDAVSVELTPKPTSLNSFNGFLRRQDGTRLFFKTHTETDTIINEYYNAELLAQAGYPVIQPVFRSTEPGKQFLAYEVIEDPAVFDIAWDADQHQRDIELFASAQYLADRQLFNIYRATLYAQTAAEAAESAVHQLFYHRLVGGRLARFYGTASDAATIMLPGGSQSMAAVRRARWVINGQEYTDTLEDVIQRAVHLLQPAQADAAIVGHGDAHNGNVFFREAEALKILNAPDSMQTARPLLYFDPAFAGKHHPLLDLTKPLFHNVFAMWMYFPSEMQSRMDISLDIVDDVWHVRYQYPLSPIRELFLDSKIKGVLMPLLAILKARRLLRPDWRAYLKSALFCCPFLTMNLTDAVRFPPQISLLGLAMSVEMGAESRKCRSRIDTALDTAAAAIGL